jgi:hypothetical protein
LPALGANGFLVASELGLSDYVLLSRNASMSTHDEGSVDEVGGSNVIGPFDPRVPIGGGSVVVGVVPRSGVHGAKPIGTCAAAAITAACFSFVEARDLVVDLALRHGGHRGVDLTIVVGTGVFLFAVITSVPFP